MRRLFLILVVLVQLRLCSAQGSDVPVSAAKHAEAVRLVEISGARERLQTSLPGILVETMKKFKEQCPTCTQQFIDEWQKRFTARLTPDAFLPVFVDAYQSSFSEAELKEMIDLQTKRAAGRPEVASAALQKKLSNIMPAFMGQVVGKCTEVGAKLGGAIAQEIIKEHPEWVQQAALPKPGG